MSFFKNFDNKAVLRFLLRGVIIYLIWSALYYLYILPNGQLENWLSLNIVQVSGGILRFAGYSVTAMGRYIGLAQTPGMEIVNGCNGLAAMGLFLGFIYAFPGDNLKRIVFSFVGIAVIYIANVTRIVILCISQLYGMKNFEIMHNYLTMTVFNVIIFIMWMIWVNYGMKRGLKKAITD